MAVKPTAPDIKEPAQEPPVAASSKREPLNMEAYLVKSRNQALLLVFVAQLIIVSVIALIAQISGIASFTTPLFWVIVTISLAIGTAIHAALLRYLAVPPEDLIKAVVHVAGEKDDTTPPNPNTPRYLNNGFREILQSVYELSTTQAPATEVHSAVDSIISDGLANSPAGVIVLNHNRQVIYHNKKAPTLVNTKNAILPALVFLNEQSLDQWLDECDKKSVHAERIWNRIGDKPVGEPDRRLYDVAASYQKGNNAETVLVLIERTGEYAPEEDDMDFIAFAAHELRGPITVIRGYLDVLEDEISSVLKKDQKELLGRLVVSSNRLSGYIGNILNASRYDRRHLKLHVNKEQLANAYDLIKDDMEMRAAAQNRLLSVTIPENLPNVAIDVNSVSEVMANLIDNAIKYSFEGGQIIVTAKEMGSFVQFSVEDHGIGMPSNIMGNLFHKFYRSHRSRETIAGTGIGLYISKAIVESHGGTIDVRTVENKGSTFTFTVPTYASVADKLKAGHNNNEGLIRRRGGWIRNHSMYRGISSDDDTQHSDS